VHELRNALAAAMVAHSMITKGVVGTGGSTNALLERNLGRMRDLLDRSFSVVRMKSHKAADRRPLLLIELVEEVEATASEQARSRGLRIKVTVDSQSKISADRSDLLCALSNLVQNAIKYSKDGGIISIRSRVAGRSVLLEVEDRCGGLPPGKVEELFKPYTQKHSDRSGLGLGLTISRQAVEHNGGAIAVHDLPGKGCVFTIALPRL
jgi:signal transduction histidine kinase